MRYRSLGKTGLKVSEIGYGAWGISRAQWVGAEDEESLRSLRAAREAGVNFYDTALAYGDGHSERLIAQCFGQSSDVIIASKVPPKDCVWSVKPGAPLQNTFPKKYVLDCLDETLKNLGRKNVDIYQFHTWIDDWASQQEWQETVREMKSSGEARFVGISIQSHEPANVLKALDTGLIDTVQVIYNIFDQSPEDELFPYCQKHGIGVIVRVPFDEGSLTGKITPDTDVSRRRFPQHLLFRQPQAGSLGTRAGYRGRSWHQHGRNAANRSALLPLASCCLYDYSRHAKHEACRREYGRLGCRTPSRKNAAQTAGTSLDPKLLLVSARQLRLQPPAAIFLASL